MISVSEKFCVCRSRMVWRTQTGSAAWFSFNRSTPPSQKRIPRGIDRTQNLVLVHITTHLDFWPRGGERSPIQLKADLYPGKLLPHSGWNWRRCFITRCSRVAYRVRFHEAWKNIDWDMILHSPYSQGLTSSDYHVLWTLKYLSKIIFENFNDLESSLICNPLIQERDRPMTYTIGGEVFYKTDHYIIYCSC